MTDMEKIRVKVEQLIKLRRDALKDPCFTGRERADMVTECSILCKVLLYIDSLHNETVVDGVVYQTIGDDICRVKSSRFVNKYLKCGDKVKLEIILDE